MDLTETEKIAVLLIALGPDRAARILDRLKGDELTEVIAAMNRMKEIPPGIRRSVLEEVEGILNRQAGLPPRETTSRREDLFGRLEPYLPDHIGPIDPDWDDGETDRPSDDSPPPWQPS
ncbi:MAG: hypothetical protein QGI83_17860 [Candidatus Latescibacteria bacterium]|jgi:hypothetical protein|nr:hypothetical protein [Candidatus Latescibacterota bacterium]